MVKSNDLCFIKCLTSNGVVGDWFNVMVYSAVPRKVIYMYGSVIGALWHQMSKYVNIITLKKKYGPGLCYAAVLKRLKYQSCRWTNKEFDIKKIVGNMEMCEKR